MLGAPPLDLPQNDGLYFSVHKFYGFTYLLFTLNRHCIIGNTQSTVMCGVMVVCYMRYGVWDTSHLRL